MVGIPNGWRTFATHGYNDRIDDLETELEIAVEIAGTNNITFLVYGGGSQVQEYCKSNPIITHVQEQRNQVKISAERGE